MILERCLPVLIAAVAWTAPTAHAAGGPAAPDGGGLLAIRVGKAETIAHGTVEHAVILVEGGKIVVVGEDLPIERGIPILDRPDWVVMPGLVNPYSRIGLDSRAGSGFTPEVVASDEILASDPVYGDVLEAGVTTLGLYPPGTGVPGLAAAVRTQGEQVEDMLLADDAYLKMRFSADAKSKKLMKEGFEKADEYLEKVKKAVEKYEKALEKYEKDKKKKKSKKDDDEDDDKDKDKKSAGVEEEEDEKPSYEPPDADPQAAVYLRLRDGDLSALVSISNAADWLHLLDAFDDEEFTWNLRVPMTRELDLFHVKEAIGEAGKHVVIEPELSLHPQTMRQRNLPAELHAEGAHVVFVPRDDSLSGMEDWLLDVGRVVAAGMPRDAALRAVTLGGAEVLGLAERLGSISEGMDANLLFFDGDPLEPTSRLQAVMLEGDFVHGDVD